MTKPPIAPALEACFEQLGQLASTAADAERELATWRVIAAAPDDRGSRDVLAAALDRNLLSSTIADWSREMRAGAVEGGPLRPAVQWTHPVDGGDMILIPAGTSLLGERPLPVHVPGFSMARFPVTNAQFYRFVADTGYHGGDGERGRFLAHWVDGRPPENQEEFPVVWVSVPDAIAYCQWAGGQLPHETMWERAARGGDGRVFPWGNRNPWTLADEAGQARPRPPIRIPNRSPLAHLDAQHSCPVGRYPETRSPFGCEDLTGNVSQWCLPEDAHCEGRHPVRGACFYRRSSRTVRASHRRLLNTHRRNQWVGIRVLISC